MMVIISAVSSPQKYVAIEAKIHPAIVENDKPFLVRIVVRPADGIHVNVQPPISVKPFVEGHGGANASVKLDIKDLPRKGEYLDASKPIEVECRLTAVNSGSHKINFAVGYTFCSDNEGWCRMGNDTVSVTVKVNK